jgi:hypothetical protein
MALDLKTLTFPSFFPSISSVKTALAPNEYLSIIAALGPLTDKFLVSSFDFSPCIGNDGIQHLLTSSSSSGTIVLLDSGNYESYWKDKQADWKAAHFHNTAKQFNFDIAFAFDTQDPPQNENENINLIVKNWQSDQKQLPTVQIIPIVHGAPEQIPSIAREVARKTGVSFIAVPERKLGFGIVQRALTIEKIRKELNSLGRYVFLHVLGTGNPVSIAIFTAQGADSFDGLEWCQTVVDKSSGLLHHLSHAEFFLQNSTWNEMDFPVEVKVLAHNLSFYRNWMSELTVSVHGGNIFRFCASRFQKETYDLCESSLGWSTK